MSGLIRRWCSKCPSSILGSTSWWGLAATSCHSGCLQDGYWKMEGYPQLISPSLSKRLWWWWRQPQSWWCHSMTPEVRMPLDPDFFNLWYCQLTLGTTVHVLYGKTPVQAVEEGLHHLPPASKGVEQRVCKKLTWGSRKRQGMAILWWLCHWCLQTHCCI